MPWILFDSGDDRSVSEREESKYFRLLLTAASKRQEQPRSFSVPLANALDSSLPLLMQERGCLQSNMLTLYIMISYTLCKSAQAVFIRL